MPSWYLAHTDALAQIARVKKRLYTEDRMTGDDMRDAAHLLDQAIRMIESTPLGTGTGGDDDRGE